MRPRLETKMSWCVKCAEGFVCWRELCFVLSVRSWCVKCAEGFVCWRELCFVLSVRSAPAQMLTLFVVII